MTTIDVHAHLPCRKNLNPAEAAQTLAFSESMGVSVEEDYPAARLLSEMDQGGVQTVVLQGHPPNAGFLSVNDEIAAIVARHPDRFLAFAGVNPFEGAKAVHELERCVRELGFKGCGEFGYMDILDERCFPIYDPWPGRRPRPVRHRLPLRKPGDLCPLRAGSAGELPPSPTAGGGQGHAAGYREGHGRQRATAAEAGRTVGLQRWPIVFATR